MKNINLKNIIFTKVTNFNNYIIDKFNHLSLLKRKLNTLKNKFNPLKTKFNQISNLNKTLIFLISILFIYLFYASIPSLYDYKRLQNQLKTYLVDNYNLNINITDKIQYKILPSPHFEVKNSFLYRDIESKKNKLGEIKHLKIYVDLLSVYSQKKLRLKDIEFKNSLLFLNKNNRKFLANYFNTKNTSKKITIKKSKFFLMDKEKIISIFPIKKIDFKYNEEIFTNEAVVSGLAFNSNFILDIKKKFLEDESLNFDLKFPMINLSIKNILLPNKDNQDKYKISNKVNFFGSEIKSEFNMEKNFLSFKSKKSKIFNNQIDFNGSVELEPFYLKSDIILEKMNLIRILKKENFILSIIDSRNFVHKNFNSKISVDIKNFSKDNIFNNAKLFIEIQNELLKFDNTKLFSEKFGSLKVLNGNLYSDNKNIFLNLNVLLDIKNQKKFYNFLQIQKKYRIDLEKINLGTEINLNTGKIKILNFKINNIDTDDLTKKITKVIQNNNVEISKNFNNWIVMKRFLNSIILEANQE